MLTRRSLLSMIGLGGAAAVLATEPAVITLPDAQTLRAGDVLTLHAGDTPVVIESYGGEEISLGQTHGRVIVRVW